MSSTDLFPNERLRSKADITRALFILSVVYHQQPTTLTDLERTTAHCGMEILQWVLGVDNAFGLFINSAADDLKELHENHK